MYDCDTRPYWVNDTDWQNADRKWGRFIEGGKAYQIDDPNTPRPWLNYLCNDTFGAVISNRGLGFHWLYSTLLRITKYEHPIDYLPRDFEDGRGCWIEEDGCAPVNVFSDTDDLVCVHRPGISEFSATIRQLHCKIEVFVPPDMPGEIMRVTLKNLAAQPRSLRMRFEQTWSFATFGIHTAEEGIPYLSTPGTALSSKVEPDALWATCADPARRIPAIPSWPLSWPRHLGPGSLWHGTRRARLPHLYGDRPDASPRSRRTRATSSQLHVPPLEPREPNPFGAHPA